MLDKVERKLKSPKVTNYTTFFKQELKQNPLEAKLKERFGDPVEDRSTCKDPRILNFDDRMSSNKTSGFFR